jgi:hypothetical protein
MDEMYQVELPASQIVIAELQGLADGLRQIGVVSGADAAERAIAHIEQQDAAIDVLSRGLVPSEVGN